MAELLFHKTIRLAVSDDVRLTKLETTIIDSKTFQRLRQIKQLGPAVWVYPTAVHTRFDHSIGVLATVDSMVSAINEAKTNVRSESAPTGWTISTTQRKLARLYGLLHDISHVPFGHTLEDELRIFSSHDAFQDTKTATPRFEIPLGPDSPIGKSIITHEGNEFYERFRNIYLKGKYDRLEVAEDGRVSSDEFIYYLVSDTVCADLVDYLQRDSLFCNLGLRAPVRILNYLYVDDIETPAGTRSRVIIRLWKAGGSVRSEGKPRRDLLTDLATLLDSRYMLAERVYFHPAKLKVGAMIGRAAFEALRVGALNEQKLLTLGDDTLLAYLANLSATEVGRSQKQQIKNSAVLAAELAQAVLDRDLYTRVYRYQEEDFNECADDHISAKDFLLKNLQDADVRAEQEDELAQTLGLRRGDILLYVGPRKMNMKIAEAIVDWRGERKKISDLKSTDDEIIFDRLRSIQNSHLRLWVVDLYVHPSVPYQLYETIKSAFQAKFGARKDRRAHWLEVLNHVSGDISDNFKHFDIALAISEVATRLAKAEPARAAAKGQEPRSLILSLIRENLDPKI